MNMHVQYLNGDSEVLANISEVIADDGGLTLMRSSMNIGWVNAGAVRRIRPATRAETQAHAALTARISTP